MHRDRKRRFVALAPALSLALALASCDSADDAGGRTPLDVTAGPPIGSGANPGAAPGGAVPGASAGQGAGPNDPGSDVPDPQPMSLEGSPLYSRLVRLTNEQWRRSVRDILGLSEVPEAARGFEEPVAGTTDFANNEHVLGVTNDLWSSYQLAAEQAAELVTGSSATLSALYSGTDAAGFIRKLGRRAFRRPLTSAEEQSYATLFAAGETLSSNGSVFARGAGLVIRAMLQSPHFLYRAELAPAGAPLTGYEVAAKLSFWLRGTTPSDELLDAAGAGQLDTADSAAAFAAEMLEQPDALVTMQQFHRELLRLDLFTTLSKLGVPDYTPALNGELEEASYRYFDRIFQQNLGLRDMLTSTVGYVGPAMASIYGVPGPTAGMQERDLGPARAGYFAQLPFLALYAFNEQPDPIHRGVTLNLDFLCADPGLPIPNLPPVPALQPGQTNREMITMLTEGCGRQCHTFFINPLGFAFEHFDGMGRLRTMDNGKPVDTRAAYPFSEGYREFADSAELMALMADSRQAHACYSKKIASHALQRDIVESDLPTLDAMTNVSLQGGSLKDVMVALVRDPAFRMRRAAP